MPNLYWPVYKNLEKELIALSEQIHMDDRQLSVYSVKITELLLRTSVEIESIAKELYFLNKPSNAEEEPYFDTVCLARLEDIWTISAKEVIVSSPYFYFEENENKVLTPLKKSNKRGTSGADWKKAYQAVKHNRVKNLEKGNIKHFIRALAALYLLNIYYKGDDVVKHLEGIDDLSLGSDIFSVTGCTPAITADGDKITVEPVDAKYTCLITYSNKMYSLMKKAGKKDREIQNNFLIRLPEVQKYINDKSQSEMQQKISIHDFVNNVVGKANFTKAMNTSQELSNLITKGKKIIVLNKNQKIYPTT